MSMALPVAGPRPGRLQHYCLCVTIAAVILSVLMHMATLYAIYAQVHPGNAAITPMPKPKRPPEPPRETLQFVALDDLEDEKSDPSKADVRGKHSRLARETNPRLELPKGAAFVEKGGPITPVKTATMSPRSIARVATPAKPPEPIQRPATPKRPPEATRPPPGALPTETPRPVARVKPEQAEPKPTAKTTPNRPHRPPVVDLRNSRPSTGSAPKQNRKTSAELAGTRSMEILKARWGDYMQKVALQLHEAVLAERTAARRSFHAGRITLHFGIKADGTITKPKLLVAPEKMLSERGLALRALLNAAPFPRLTPAMAKDPNFGRITVNFIFQ